MASLDLGIRNSLSFFTQYAFVLIGLLGLSLLLNEGIARDRTEAAAPGGRDVSRPRGEGIRLVQVSVGSMGEVEKSLDFFMGKNTPARKDFIVENLSTEVL